MAAEVAKIKVTNPYAIRTVMPKRDHESKKDYPHQDANGFAEELGENPERPLKQPAEREHRPKRPPEPIAKQLDEDGEPTEGHLDIEA